MMSLVPCAFSAAGSLVPPFPFLAASSGDTFFLSIVGVLNGGAVESDSGCKSIWAHLMARRLLDRPVARVVIRSAQIATCVLATNRGQLVGIVFTFAVLRGFGSL